MFAQKPHQTDPNSNNGAAPTAPVPSPAPAEDVNVNPAVPMIPLPGYRILPPPQRGLPITTIPVLLLALAVTAAALLLLLGAYPTTPEEGANKQIRKPLKGLCETHGIDLEHPPQDQKGVDKACLGSGSIQNKHPLAFDAFRPPRIHGQCRRPDLADRHAHRLG